MNIYSRKLKWKIFLLSGAFLIAAGSYWFTKNLTQKLAEEERKKVELWAKAQKQLVNSKDLSKDYSFALDVIRNNETVPVVLTDKNKNVIASVNLDPPKKNRVDYYKNIIQEMKAEHGPIIIDLPDGTKNYIFYKDSFLLTQLFYFPLIQLGVVALFLLVSYYAFSTSRRAEQNQVWVGMSKETAHQLGTPTSSLMANLELLRLKLDDQTIIKEIEKDVTRLEKITERFSKIGANPRLENENIVPILLNAIFYIRSRTSKKIIYNLNFSENDEIYVPLNKALFEWVIENLVKNAIDSMNGNGNMSINLYNKQSQLIIDVTDNGKGIPKTRHKTIFQPGYSTKKRGWGLGLSLAKRIVEVYHKGKIFVYQSEPKKGTTMRISLKKSQPGSTSQ